MTWFRDYIYIPLGGSYSSKWKTIRNTIIVFLISGLWHGANWTFVFWGLFHAFLITFYILMNTKRTRMKNSGIVSGDHLFPSIIELLQMIITFLLVVIGWIIFRSADMSSFVGYMHAFCNNPFCGQFPSPGVLYYMLLGYIMLGVEWLQRDKQHALQLPNNSLFRYKPMRWALYIFMYIFIVSSTGQDQSFLYFQF